ncbi:MAG TPA: hypothetical protein ENK10_05470, partial [Acidobacteria bacterium]|nr:hypothetical protein [Acidobacteriota bacterium]
MRARYSRLVISYTLEMQLPRVYFAHEVPILEALHGADGVRVEEDNVGEAEIDPRTELRRLKVVYKDFQTDDGLSVVDA